MWINIIGGVASMVIGGIILMVIRSAISRMKKELSMPPPHNLEISVSRPMFRNPVFIGLTAFSVILTLFFLLWVTFTYEIIESSAVRWGLFCWTILATLMTAVLWIAVYILSIIRPMAHMLHYLNSELNDLRNHSLIQDALQA